MNLAKTVLIVAAACMSAPSVAQEAEAPAVALAKVAATQWLALADSSQFAASWDQAARPFQAAIPKPQWESVMQAVRTPLGAVRSRQLKSADFSQTMPGSPDGEYVVVRFETQFENKARAVETITPMKGKDGVWRVSGYVIQ